MRRTAVALAVVLLACGGRPEVVEPAVEVMDAGDRPEPEPVAYEEGRATVEEVVRALIQGLQQQDRDLVMSLFPPAGVVKEAFVCPGGNILEEAMGEAVEDIDDGMAEMAEGNVWMEFVEIVPRLGKTETYMVGQEVEDGCTAGMEITVREVMVTVNVTEGGTTEQDTDEIVTILIDGKWYLVGPD